MKKHKNISSAKVLLLSGMSKKSAEKVHFLYKNKKNRVKRIFFTEKFGSMKKKL